MQVRYFCEMKTDKWKTTVLVTPPQKLYIVHTQCQSCWWSGDAKSQGISRHTIDLICMWYSLGGVTQKWHVTVRCCYNTVNFLKYSQKTPHSSPIRVRYGVSFVDPASDWYHASVHVSIYEIFYNIRLHYNGTRLYLLQVCEWWYIHVLPSFADIIQNKLFKLLVGFLVIAIWRTTRECFG